MPTTFMLRLRLQTATPEAALRAMDRATRIRPERCSGPPSHRVETHRRPKARRPRRRRCIRGILSIGIAPTSEPGRIPHLAPTLAFVPPTEAAPATISAARHLLDTCAGSCASKVSSRTCPVTKSSEAIARYLLVVLRSWRVIQTPRRLAGAFAAAVARPRGGVA